MYRTKEKTTGPFDDDETLSNYAWEWLKERYEYTCLCCKRQEPAIELVSDHVIPRARGGQNVVGNVQPLCRSCNAKKHAKTIDYREAQYWQPPLV